MSNSSTLREKGSCLREDIPGQQKLLGVRLLFMSLYIDIHIYIYLSSALSDESLMLIQ